MDSTLITKELLNIKQYQDSISIKLSSINHNLVKLKEVDLIDKYLPVIYLLVGGVLTYLFQVQLKKIEKRINDEQKIKTSIFNLKYYLQLVKFHLKEIAYLEVDSKYQYYLYQKTKGEAQKRALEEHYGDYKYISENRYKLNTSVSNINAELSGIYKLLKKPMPHDCYQRLLQFTNHMLTLKKQKDYNIKETVDEVKFFASESTLLADYNQHINELMIIVDKLPTKIK